MANQRILTDTSVIIDFLRRKNKEDSLLWKIREQYLCFMSVITLFELLAGAKTERHINDVEIIKRWIPVIEFDAKIAVLSSRIFKELRAKNRLIEFRDIFIAATAIQHDFYLATLNKKHFLRIENINLFNDSNLKTTN